jgi:hypothetical protein
MRSEADVATEAWQIVNSLIEPGALDGTGRDLTAQRNGFILATNELAKWRDKLAAAPGSASCTPLTERDAHSIKQAVLAAASQGGGDASGQADPERLARSLIKAFRLVDEATAAGPSAPKEHLSASDLATTGALLEALGVRLSPAPAADPGPSAPTGPGWLRATARRLLAWVSSARSR